MEQIKRIELNLVYEPVDNMPGYYWFNKRKFQIISEETLKKAINEYNDKNKNQLFLSDSEFHS